MPYLSGLLNEPRKCPRGHGTMEKQAGTWGIPQVQLVPAGVLLTGVYFGASMYRCNTCGTLELVDEEQPRGTA